VKVDEADEQASINKAKRLPKAPYVNAHIIIWGKVRLDSGQLKIFPCITVAQKLGGQDLAERKIDGRAAMEPDHLQLKDILAADLADLVALIHGMAWYNAAKSDPAHWDKAIAVFEQVKSAEGRFYKGLSYSYRSERVAAPVDDLKKAVSAYKSALEVRTRKDLPQDWAMTQNNLGNVLQTLGKRLEGAEGSKKLEEAVSAYKSALEVRTRKDLPIDWAMTQENLGIAFAEIAKREKGENGIGYINESIACFDNALSVFDATNFPYNHRKATDNKNKALQIKAGL
jgi:tetratricopeptide (TPR) repeat protein